MENSIPLQWSIQQLAEVLKLHRDTVSAKLKAAGLPHVIGPKNSKLFDAEKALKILCSTGPEGESEKEQESILLLRAKRQSAELELAERQRQVIPIDEVLEVVSKEYAFIRAQLRALPSSLAKRLAIQTDPLQCFEMLSGSIDSILSELQADAQDQLATIPETPPEEPTSNE